jgi:ketosteroid isomerase-like protein
MTTSETLIAFNDAITRADLGALGVLVAPDHVFIDPAGHEVRGKNDVLAAWRGFFAAFPGYKNVFEDIHAEGAHAMIRGHSVCNDPRLAGPALWRVEVIEEAVTVWHVMEDTEENRRSIGL